MREHFILSNYLKASKTFDIYRDVFEAKSLEYQYLPVEIPTQQMIEVSETELRSLRNFFSDFRRNPNAVSIVVSNPFKQLVLQFCDELSEEAARMGAVNLIVKRNNNLMGSNIDGEAFFLGQNRTTGYDFPGKTVLVLGCGGVSTAVAFKLARVGVRELRLFDIQKNKQAQLRDKLGNHFPLLSVKEAESLDERAIAEADVIYNGTGVGKKSDNPSSVLATPLPDHLQVPATALAIDSNYTPWSTLFLEQCAKNGCQTTNGFSHMIAFVALHLSSILDSEIDYGFVREIGERHI